MRNRIGRGGVVAGVLVWATLAGLAASCNRSSDTATATATTAPAVSPSLAAYVSADLDLDHELQKEGVWSAWFVASRGASGGSEMQAQRALTDEAVSRYGAAAAAATGSADFDSRKNDVATQLGRLAAVRSGVDGAQTDLLTMIASYYGATSGLQKTTEALATDPSVGDARVLGEIHEVDQAQFLASERNKEAMILIAVTEVGVMPRNWNDRQPCGGDGGGCAARDELTRAGDNADRAQSDFGNRATPEQTKVLADGLKGASYDLQRAQIFAAGISSGSSMTSDCASPDGICAQRLVAASVDYADRLYQVEKQLLARASA